MKRFNAVFGALLGFVLLSGLAFADQIGVVDMQAVAQKYTKAQAVSEQIKAKEEDLKKYRDDLMGQLKAGEKLSPVEKKKLEERLNGEFAAKFKEYRTWTDGQEEAIKTDFDHAIQQVAQAQNLNLVLPKQTVLQGGKDITQDVITILNK
jgi:outer membrane protein